MALENKLIKYCNGWYSKGQRQKYCKFASEYKQISCIHYNQHEGSCFSRSCNKKVEVLLRKPYQKLVKDTPYL